MELAQILSHSLCISNKENFLYLFNLYPPCHVASVNIHSWQLALVRLARVLITLSRGFNRPARWSETISLHRHTAVTLNEFSVRRIVVEEGLVWLTETPARGDRILRAGESHECAEGPVVLEGLKESRITVQHLH